MYAMSQACNIFFSGKDFTLLKVSLHVILTFNMGLCKASPDKKGRLLGHRSEPWKQLLILILG